MPDRCRPVLEALEDRTLLSVYSDLSGLLGNLNTLESHLESAANLVQHIPFLDQAGQQLGDLLHNAKDPLIVSTELVNALNTALMKTTDTYVTTSLNSFAPVKQAIVNSAPDANGEHIEIDLWLHQDLAKITQPINLSFALPGLPVKVDGTGGVNVSVAYDAELAFGLTTQNGKPEFFWKGMAIPNGSGDQLTVDVNANLQGASLDARVGLLKGTLSDNPSDPKGPSKLDVAFHVAPFSDITSVPTPTVGLNQAHIALVAAVSFDSTTQMNNWFPKATTVQLPSITADLDVDWTGSFDPSNLSVSFNNVGLDLGSALQSFIQPVVTIVQDVLGPIEPIINLITTPIPGLSDLSHLINQGDVTLYGIAGEVASQVVGPEITPIINLVGDLLPIVKDINNLNKGEIQLGSFNLDGQQTQLANDAAKFNELTDTTNFTDLTSLAPKVIGAIPDLSKQLGQIGGQIQKAMSDLRKLLNPGGANFEFPILDDPLSCAFKLLLGQDAPLFKFTAQFDVPPVGPQNQIPDLGFSGVQLSFNDGMDFQGSFQLAYDTFGIREYFNDLFPTDHNIKPQNKPQDLLDGFYIDSDKTKLQFQGKLGFGPELSPFPGVTVQLAGGLETGNNGADSFTISLDGAGKIRLNQLFNQNCLFDAKGELDAGVSVDVKLGFDAGPLGFIGVEHDFNIASVVLVGPYPQNTCLGNVSQENIQLATVVNGTLVLNLGGKDVTDYLTQHNLSTETFEIKHEIDPNDPNASVQGNEMLSVTGFGITQHFTGIHDISADGSAVSFNQDVTVDAGVLDDAVLQGGPQQNKLTYLGSGTARLYGNPSPGESSQLAGGTGNNFETGGAGPDMLIGGASAAGKFNTLMAGSGDQQLYAGPTSADVLQGGSGNDIFYAGGGHVTMTGGTMTNVFNWIEGNGPLDVTGGGILSSLSVLGTKQGDKFTAGQDTNGDGGVLVDAPGALIHAFGIQTLGLDGGAGSATYVLNDLSQTPVKNVGLNLHEESANDPASDHLIVNAPPGNDNVEISWDEQLAAQGEQTTKIFIATQAGGAFGGPSASYQISAAISKKSDVLYVNTMGGADKVLVDSTQPDLTGVGAGGQVFVNTGAGDDQITAGSPNVGLDEFFGRLNVEAGSGHNQVIFDESASLVHDTVTLTASQVIRSKQTDPVTTPPNPGGVPHTEIGYPFIINYQATSGDFTPVSGDAGVIFKTAHGSTNLFVAETGMAAPTEVDCGGGLFNSNDVIVVGYDGQGKTAFPNTKSTSTLAFLNSILTVHGSAGISPVSVLDVDDEAAPAGETYTLDVAPKSLGVLHRPGAADVLYDFTATTLNAGELGNSIYVPGVQKFTTATINAGNGHNAINVGEPPNASPPVGRLDAIAGVLTINGGTGVNDLSINDQGNVTPQQYFLGASQLMRLGNPSVVVNFFDIADLVFNASDNNMGTSFILVSGTPLGTPVIVNTGDGDAFLEVEDLDQIRGALTFNWTSGKKDLTVNDGQAKAAATYEINNTPAVTTVQRTQAALVTWNGFLDTVHLFPGLAHANTVKVDSVAAGTTMTIEAGLATDSVLVAPVTQSLDDISGALTVHGNKATRLILDDQQGPTGRDYQLTASDLLFSASLLPIQFSSLAALTLNAAAGAKVEVQASAKGATDRINLGGGSNQVIVGSTGDMLSAIQGTVSIVGKTGTDTLTLNDQKGSFMTVYTLTGSSIAGDGSAAVKFQKMGSVTLNGGPGVELYQVNAIGSTPITINAHGSSNELTGPDRNNKWRITGANAAILDGAVSATGIQNLAGGTVNDTFTLAPGGSLSGFLLGQAPSSIALIEGFSQLNATLQDQIDLVAGESTTLLARYDAATDSWYGGELLSTANGFEPIIYRRHHGVVTILATGAVIPSANGTLAFKVNGPALDLYLNNTLLVSASDSVLGAGGAAVQFGQGVAISNFSAA